MIEFSNQEGLNVNVSLYSDFGEQVLEAAAKGKSVSVAFVSDEKMCRLNQNFRYKNSTTDVLSFPYISDEFDSNDDFLGDIVISPEQAKRQASENNLSLELEVKQLILHGILHLLGYDHETDKGEMNTLELKFRDKLKIS